ncbi:hypothetical protein V6C42_04945 [Pseudoclostridium thermosuccinogenes]|uniref:hypothetical protein n=1 Tax=Clostridium thermosuccinogenes TaxID=84032 RepID=UPI000CCC8924|nr:hypothetical protein [Pseudoclostridium thermosuccinogenes]PNT92414.1 hypothetical protein CDQ83_02215 [Pseudoclostridium thermosuccinogenes]
MSQRDVKADIFKGLLVVGMIFAHVLQFFGDMNLYPASKIISDYANIITFTGFVFCFGYVIDIAYMGRSFKEVWRKIIISAFRILIAFYISGISYRLFIDKRQPNMNNILKIITLSDIPGYSEFLLSFALYVFLVALLFKPIKMLLHNKMVFWIVFFTLFLTTFIPYDKIKINQLGLLIGTTKFYAFPVLQYMSFFILGMYFHKYKIGFNIRFFFGSLLLSGISIVSIIKNGGALPGRFPPTIMWLILPAFALYMYYLLSSFLSKSSMIVGALQPIGRNSLVYLILSNIIIFAVKSTNIIILVSTLQGLLYSVLLMLMIRYLIRFSRA